MYRTISKDEPVSTKKSGGHGKGAIGRTDTHLYDPNDVVIIGHDTKDGPEHYLCDVESNATPLNEATVRFTKKHGIIQPVVGQRDGDRTVITAGRGRTRHLREANAQLIAEGAKPWPLPVVIKRGDENTMLEIRTGENAHRREVSPFARAKEANMMLSKGMSKQDVADALCVTTAQLNNNILPLLELAQPVVHAIKSGKLSATAGATMAALPRDEQVKQLTELTADGAKPTVAETRNKARAARGKQPLETPKGRLIRIGNALDKCSGCAPDASREDFQTALGKVAKSDLIDALVTIHKIASA